MSQTVLIDLIKLLAKTDPLLRIRHLPFMILQTATHVLQLVKEPVQLIAHTAPLQALPPHVQHYTTHHRHHPPPLPPRFAGPNDSHHKNDT